MSVQKPALTTVQALQVLETLSLLTADQHKNSKLVIYDSKLELESNASLNRSINAAAASTVSTLWYLAGYPSTTGVRDLSQLPPLMERVSLVLKLQEPQDNLSKCAERYALAQRADQGLTALTVNQYLSDVAKSTLVEDAQKYVRAIMNYFKSLGGDQPGKSAEQQLRVERDALGRTLSEKEREIAALKQQVSDKQQTIDAQKKQIDEISRLKAAIVNEALNAPVTPISQAVVIERISQLAQLLAQMQSKQ